MKRICRISLFISALSALTISSAFAAALTVDEYLGQVSETNPGLKASTLAGEGYSMMADGADIIIYPYLFANFTDFDDRQETPNPAFQGDRTMGR